MLAALVASIVYASDAQLPEDRVRVPGERRTPERDDSVPSTRLGIPAEPPPFRDAADVLREVPGLTVQRTGSIAQFSSISIRGTDFRHTQIFIGDVPLGAPESGAFDLSLLPLDAFEAVEVHRGGAPVWLSSGAIGGALQLHPRRASEDEAAIQVAAGALGARSASGRVSLNQGAWRTVVLGRFDRADNDFRFQDDNATRFDPGDDRISRRRNADFRQAHGFAHAERDTRLGRFTLVGLGLSRAQGEPGSGSEPALSTRRDRSFAFGSLGWAHEGVWGATPFDLGLSVGAGHQEDAVEDPFAEIGLAPEDGMLTFTSANARLAARLAPAAWLDLTAVLTAGGEASRFDDRVSAAEFSAERGLASGAAEARFHHGRFEIRPSARVELVDARGDGARSDVLGTFRLGWAVTDLGPVTLSGQVARGVRAPTLQELFGDGQLRVASAGLEPERSLQTDVGLMLNQGPFTAELRGWWSRVDDLIRLVQTAQDTLVADNVARARIIGLEAAAAAKWAHVELTGALTAQAVDDARGERIAFRPGLTAFARVRGRTGPVGDWLDDLSLAIDMEHRGAFLAADGGIAPPEVPERTVFGLEVLSEHAGVLRAFARVLDVADRGGADFLGFPLPGRRFEVGARLRAAW